MFMYSATFTECLPCARDSDRDWGLFKGIKASKVLLFWSLIVFSYNLVVMTNPTCIGTNYRIQVFTTYW